MWFEESGGLRKFPEWLGGAPKTCRGQFSHTPCLPNPMISPLSHLKPNAECSSHKNDLKRDAWLFSGFYLWRLYAPASLPFLKGPSCLPSSTFYLHCLRTRTCWSSLTFVIFNILHHVIWPHSFSFLPPSRLPVCSIHRLPIFLLLIILSDGGCGRKQH